MSDNGHAKSKHPEWLTGRGLGPQLKWQMGTDGALTTMAMSRETGHLFVCDQAGTLYRLDRGGQIAAMTRLKTPLVRLVWSDDGRFGAGISGEDSVVRFDADLRIVQTLNIPDVCLCLAIAPYGNHLAVGLSNGMNLVFNERKKRIAQFETMRPLSFIEFCSTESLMFGAAEHGLLCSYNLAGAQIWQEKNWANVGALRITGDGDLVYLASFGHGVQTLDGDGESVGSYVLDGAVNRLDVSFEPQRLVASTIERSLYWLDADGELLWATKLDDDVIELICDPLGEWIVIGLETKGLFRLDWGGIANPKN